MGKNCQNLFNTGELVVQGYSEEITSKVQKYARMSATQFVPYSYRELTIENIKETCIRHFTRQFQLGKTWPMMFYQVTKGLLLSSCHRFQISVVIHFRFIKAVGDNSTEVRDPDSSKSFCEMSPAAAQVKV